jgi:glycosyltransferase 2 family protein
VSAVGTIQRRSAGAVRGALGAVVSVLSLAAVVWWAARQGTPELPSSPRALAIVAAAVGVYGAATVVRGWRWHRILRGGGIPHERADAYLLLPVGYMGNTVLPARGGELLRVFLMAGRGGALRREVLGSIVSERIVDAATLVLLFAALTWVGVAGTPLGDSPALVALLALLAGFAGVRAYLALRRRGRLHGFAERVRPLVRAARPLLGRLGVTLAGATVGIWLLEATVLWLLGQALGLGVTPLGACFVLVLSAFLSLVPAAPGYVGTYDAAIIFGLKGLGITGAHAVGFAVMTRFVIFGPITLAGLALLIGRYGGLSRLRRLRTEG